MRKKVTVITLQNVRNYGSVLQALATQRVFQELGVDVDFINYNKLGKLTRMDKVKDFTKGKGIIAKIAYPFILIPSFIREDKVFKSFIKRHLNQQEKEYYCIDEIGRAHV